MSKYKTKKRKTKKRKTLKCEEEIHYAILNLFDVNENLGTLDVLLLLEKKYSNQFTLGAVRNHLETLKKRGGLNMHIGAYKEN